MTLLPSHLYTPVLRTFYALSLVCLILTYTEGCIFIQICNKDSFTAQPHRVGTLYAYVSRRDASLETTLTFIFNSFLSFLHPGYNFISFF